MTTHIELKITKARANLIMKEPFFGALALRLKMQATDKIETADIDGETIRYNPKYVEKLTMAQTTGMMAHLVMHPAMLHHTRRGARDKDKWNEACDHSINTIVKNAGFDLPEGKFADPKFNGMTAEHIYTLLPDRPKNPDQDQGQGQGQGQGQDKGNDPGGDGGVNDSPSSKSNGGSDSTEQQEESEWKIAVAQAAHVARQQGKLPADLERMLDELMEPVIPWRDILRRFMTEKANDDFSWARGNRRLIAQGLYLPSRTSEGTGEMVVVIDTSGSIGQKELTEFGSEIKAIIADVRPSKTYVMYCDARVAHVDEFGPDDTLEFAAHGGGGTDFRPPFQWLENKGIEPKALVYLTDGYGSFPEQEAAFPTMWCINNADVVPPHGEHLILDPNA